MNAIQTVDFTKCGACLEHFSEENCEYAAEPCQHTFCEKCVGEICNQRPLRCLTCKGKILAVGVDRNAERAFSQIALLGKTIVRLQRGIENLREIQSKQLFSLGNLFLAFGNLEKAKDFFETAIKELILSPADKAHVRLKLGDIHSRLKSWRNACTLYQAVLEEPSASDSVKDSALKSLCKVKPRLMKEVKEKNWKTIQDNSTMYLTEIARYRLPKESRKALKAILSDPYSDQDEINQAMTLISMDRGTEM